MISTVVIDDEPIALEKLKSYVKKSPGLSLAAAFESSVEAAEFLAETNVDLLITDIDMPDLNGLELVESLPQKPMVIFTTAFDRYAVDSYRVRALDYLLKPFGFEDFRRAVGRASEVYANDAIFIKSDSRFIRIPRADITYIKGYGEYLQIFLRNTDRPILTLSNFASIREKLGEGFMQVHRSYVVNLRNVVSVERTRVLISSSIAVPVSDSFRAALLAWTEAAGRP